jgi:hypothetical protein
LVCNKLHPRQCYAYVRLENTATGAQDKPQVDVIIADSGEVSIFDNATKHV